MRAADLDLARKLTAPMCEKTNSRNSRLELAETSSPSYVSVRRHFWSSISVRSLLRSGGRSRKVLSRITRRATPRQTKEAVRGVASPETCVYYQAGVRGGTYVQVRGRDDGVS